jgi:hypothetical protein
MGVAGLAGVASLALLLPARGEAGDAVDFHGAVQLRATSERNLPGTDVRYDPGTGEFALGSYLRTEGADSFGSTLVSLGLEGRLLGGDLHWVVTADTGELRRQRFHQTGSVCWSPKTASGLAIPGSGECGLYRLSPLRWARIIVPVEETPEGAPELTSNGRLLRDEASYTWFVREAYAAYDLGRAGFVTLSAGRKRTTVADGYVFDDYATGAELRADLGAVGPPWDLSAAVFQPTRDFPRTVEGISPMVVVRADYLPSLFDHAGLFAAGLRERTGGMGNVLKGAVEERLVGLAAGSQPDTPLHRAANQLLAATLAADYSSDATLGWLGTSGKVTLGQGLRLGWTGALLAGELASASTGSRLVVAEQVHLRGQLASLRCDADLGHGVRAGASLLYLSGDELPRASLDTGGQLRPATGTYRGFVAVAPYLTETNIFFGGGLSESFADRQSSTPGVNGRGVVAPVVSLGWDPTEDLSLHAKGAWLRAVAPGPFGGLVYGTELDVELSYEATSWLVLGAELDALYPGDFFRGRGPLTKGLLALDVLTP